MDWLTIGSIVLNVVLFALLFFKGPLNELAKEYLLDKYRARKRRKELLKRLNSFLDEVLTLYMQTVIFSHLAVHDRTDAERQQAIERRDKCAARIKEGLQFIRDSRLDFSKDIQDLIYEFERSLQHIRDRMTLLLTPDGVVSLLRELKDVLVVTVPPIKERIQAEIDK